MRNPPRHLKPAKSNIRKTEKAIEAAKKAKIKEAELMEKYKRQAQKEWEKSQREQQRAFRHAERVPDTDFPQVEPPAENKSSAVFTVLGILFLLIAVVTLLWQFRFFDRFFQKSVSIPDTSSVSVTEEVSEARDNTQ